VGIVACIVQAASELSLLQPKKFLCALLALGLGLFQLIHLGHSLQEFVVLALFVGVSFILLLSAPSNLAVLSDDREDTEQSTHSALPRKIVCLEPAFIERNQEVRTAVSVRKRNSGIRHFLGRRSCNLISKPPRSSK
jgi:hypothetical protein